jgi:hypothetical protein
MTMRRIVEEVSGEGLESLLGKQVAIWCLNYIYAGKLVGVNEQDVKLEDPKVVYETGPLNSNKWQDAQDLPSPWYVRTSSIESYGEVSHA